MLEKEQSVRNKLGRLNYWISKRIDSICKREDFTVFLLGPAIPTPTKNSNSLEIKVGNKRTEIYNLLESKNFFVVYGEDLINVGNDEIEKNLNIQIKEKIIAKEANLIIILASSPGSAAEVGFISQNSLLCKKTVIAIHKKHENGYVNVGSIKEAVGHGARVIKFTDNDIGSCKLKETIYRLTLEAFESFLSDKLNRQDIIEWTLLNK